MGRKRGVDFVRQLIKGKIAEIVFQHMFSENDYCTVLPFGYESITPALAQYQHLIATQEALDELRNTPDFILLKPDNTQLVYVQVKYRKRKDERQVLDLARTIGERWHTAWLFLATVEGFFMGPCSAIVEDHGEIKPLLAKWLSRQIQERYLALLREFEP